MKVCAITLHGHQALRFMLDFKDHCSSPRLPATVKGLAAWRIRVSRATRWGAGGVNVRYTAVCGGPICGGARRCRVQFTPCSRAEQTEKREVGRSSGEDHLTGVLVLAQVILEGNVYDLAAFAKVHPGGGDLLHIFGGSDATPHYYMLHQHQQLRTAALEPYKVLVRACTQAHGHRHTHPQQRTRALANAQGAQPTYGTARCDPRSALLGSKNSARVSKMKRRGASLSQACHGATALRVRVPGWCRQGMWTLIESVPGHACLCVYVCVRARAYSCGKQSPRPGRQPQRVNQHSCSTRRRSAI